MKASQALPVWTTARQRYDYIAGLLATKGDSFTAKDFELEENSSAAMSDAYDQMLDAPVTDMDDVEAKLQFIKDNTEMVACGDHEAVFKLVAQIESALSVLVQKRTFEHA